MAHRCNRHLKQGEITLSSLDELKDQNDQKQDHRKQNMTAFSNANLFGTFSFHG